MSRPNTYEQMLLSKAQRLLESYSTDFRKRMLVVEYCAALEGGFPIGDYWNFLGIPVGQQDYSSISECATQLRNLLNNTEIPFPLAISSLMSKPVPLSEQKKEGAFYTDFRLAGYVAKECRSILKKESSVADIAAGTGILLAGVALLYKEKYPKSFDYWIANKVFAYDLSEDALRGALAAIASLSSSLKAIKSLWGNWKKFDSLTTEHLDNCTFDIVVGNPPWGKIKLTRHQFSLEKGLEHAYGTAFQDLDEDSYDSAKKERGDYISILRAKYSLLGSSDVDYYIAFIERALGLLAPSGRLVYIVPAGLIRSQGTFAIRERVFFHYSSVALSLFDNKDNYFSIDSRFKFLVIRLDNNGKHGAIIQFHNFRESQTHPKHFPVRIGLRQLSKYRKDLTIPEVYTKEELDLYFRICEKSGDISDWSISISREVDMTNDKHHFSTTREKDSIPVIEGRMVQPYRLGAKRYISGSGRKAIWEPCKQGLHAQFFISKKGLSPEIKNRVNHTRVGYCDIAGQTNERSMMAAVVPKDVVCGNKVPTILFGGEFSEEHMYLWLGVVNSIVFDWLLRRVLTTTVNYFLLWSIPFPKIKIRDSIAIEIIECARVLSEMGEDYYDNDAMGYYRAKIDVLVAKAYGLDFNDIHLILDDFPLLDRGQPSISGKSSITKTLILSIAEHEFKRRDNTYRLLSSHLYGIGAKPFILSEMKTVSNMKKVLLVVYKEIVYGDLSKFTATSNIAETGGGARDLRFSPSDEFLPIFERMFPDRQGSFNVGKFYWPNGKETDVKIARPTRSRANEMRICKINQCFPPEYYPTDAEDKILLLVYDDELKVTPYFTSRESLKNEEWDPIIRSKILQGLDAERGARQSAMGYLDIENDNFYTNGRINSDY